MGYAIKYVKGADYISLVLTGDVTREDHEKSTDEAARMVIANTCHRLLVDITQMVSRMAVGEDYEFVAGLQARYPQGMQIAVVVPPDEFEHFQFIEDVALNRGLMLNVFRDKGQAIAWLLDH